MVTLTYWIETRFHKNGSWILQLWFHWNTTNWSFVCRDNGTWNIKTKTLVLKTTTFKTSSRLRLSVLEDNKTDTEVTGLQQSPNNNYEGIYQCQDFT